jgi:hypothetical protein
VPPEKRRQRRGGGGGGAVPAPPRGASLAEVLAAVGVAALLVAAVLPQLVVPPAVPLGQAAAQLTADLALARRLAIAGRTSYALVLAPAGGPYTSYSVGPLGGPPGVDFPKALPPGVTATGPAQITFGPDGAASSDAVLRLAAGGASAQVQVTAATGFAEQQGP